MCQNDFFFATFAIDALNVSFNKTDQNLIRTGQARIKGHRGKNLMKK